jgi:type IX secretion system PorP/SprF family membrane protein
MKLKHLWVFCALVITIQLDAQKLHFTQFEFAPLVVNPALTGSFQGTIRLSGIFRDQYFGSQSQNIGSSPFQNLSLSAEYNALRGFGKHDWVAVGFNMGQHSAGGLSIEETAGTGEYKVKNNVFNISAAYHIGLGKKGLSVFSIGAQYGSYSRSVGNDAVYRSELLGGGDPNYLGQNMDGTGFSDLSAGVTFTARNGKSNLFRTGLNFTHILTGNQSLLMTGSRDDKSLGFIAFANMESAMGKRSSFRPAILFQKDGAFSHLEAQVKFGYLLKPEKQLSLNYGLGIRPGESFQVLLGADYGQLRAGISYDLVTGGIRDAARETFELGVSYIFNIEKKQKRIPAVFCPRL